jgi:hypothetical protein
MVLWPNRKTNPPSAEAVLKRAIILKNLFVKGLVTPPPSLLACWMEKWNYEERTDFTNKMQNKLTVQTQKLREYGLWDEMDEKERRFMEAGFLEVTEQELLDANWLAESAVCLFWALEYLPELLPYDKRANPELINQDASKKPRLRRFEVIKKQRDLAELWHWRARTRQLQESGQMPGVIAGGLSIENVLQMASAKAAENGAFPAPIDNDFPAFNKSYRDLSAEEFSLANSIALERHRAFNWLCGHAPGNRWTETPTDT